jgi:hypothetical protein
MQEFQYATDEARPTDGSSPMARLVTGQSGNLGDFIICDRYF